MNERFYFKGVFSTKNIIKGYPSLMLAIYWEESFYICYKDVAKIFTCVMKVLHEMYSFEACQI